jgi:hypothetical protein
MLQWVPRANAFRSELFEASTPWAVRSSSAPSYRFRVPKNATRLFGGRLNRLRALNSFGEGGHSSLCSRGFSLLVLVMFACL